TISGGEADCLFQVQINDSATRLTCMRGEVHASDGNRETSIIGEGYLREWPSGRSEAVSAAGDSRGKNTIANALEAEQELRHLESQQQSALPY
ncbi:MAG: hypothetical protein ABJB22_06500, partial [Verrucomicrobiota bacterium]